MTKVQLKALLAVAVLLSCTQSVHAQDQVIGLLSLPELFGTGPCEAFTPAEVVLFSAADSAATVGSVRVDKYWTFHDGGGCDELVVNVHMNATDSVTRLPTLEHTYESPAAVVLQQQGRWFKVRIGSETAWLRASDRDEFFAIEQLITDGLAYFTESASGRLSAVPRRASSDPEAHSAEPGRNVRVLETRRVDNRLWVHVEVLSHSICESTEDPRVIARGWMPAHAANGEAAIWFFSRGC